MNDPSSLEAHLWNIMKLDTGRYYYVDTTWDDLDSVQDEWDENLRHEFFLCGPENLRGHVRENNPSFTDIAVAASNELYLPGLSEKSYPEDKAEMEAHPELFTETEPVTGTSETDPPESGPVSVSGSNDTTAAYSGTTAETATEIPADTGSVTTTGPEAVKETTEGPSAGVITIGPGVPDTPAQDNAPIIIAVVAGGLVAAVVVITIIVKKSKK